MSTPKCVRTYLVYPYRFLPKDTASVSEHPIPVYPQPPSGGAKIPILFGAVLALIASNVYLYLQLDKTREDITHAKESFAEEISTVIANRRSELDQLRGAAGLASAHANRRDAVLARIRGFFGLDQEG